jgi:hypothetical protein
MTIAACYLSSEGVVLGADSTTTVFVSGRGHQQGSTHHYNFAQKVFEFGDRGATAGVVLWGMGSIGDVSYRTFIAEVADDAANKGLPTFDDVVNLTASTFWQRYASELAQPIKRARDLESLGDKRTDKESAELLFWKQNLSGGFCIGGRWKAVRRPRAFKILFSPLLTAPPGPEELTAGNAVFWGCPNLIERIFYGIDEGLFERIADSGKWQGDIQELVDLVRESALGRPADLPLREAIDYVYAVIYTTIRAMKFSHLAPVCGGPIEVAAISTDRPFRWVCHKRLREAIEDSRTGEQRDDQ